MLKQNLQQQNLQVKHNVNNLQSFYNNAARKNVALFF